MGSRLRWWFEGCCVERQIRRKGGAAEPTGMLRHKKLVEALDTSMSTIVVPHRNSRMMLKRTTTRHLHINSPMLLVSEIMICNMPSIMFAAMAPEAVRTSCNQLTSASEYCDIVGEQGKLIDGPRKALALAHDGAMS